MSVSFLPFTSMSNFLVLSVILICISPTISSQTNPDIFPLIHFKSQINSSSYPPSSGACLLLWDFEKIKNPCKLQCGIQCDSLNRVTHLTLDPAGYSGTLSPYLSHLSSLIYIDLSDNQFHGRIPASLASLKSLSVIILRVNLFSGQIPLSLLSMVSLETLDLSFNSLSGSLPDFTSPNLNLLDISFNNLSGKIPKLPPSLVVLTLRGNKLTGEFTNISFAESNQLEVVDLENNLLSGTIPQWFFLIQSLQQVNLANNSFTSVEIPKPIDNNLVAIDLGFNKIEGLIPENLSRFPILASLSLRHNRYHGPIPSWLGKKGSFLTRLFLDGNFLSGVPPEGVFSGVVGSLGDNCLAKCPPYLDLCNKPQKPASLCKTK